jgi:hypothetical protein
MDDHDDMDDPDPAFGGPTFLPGFAGEGPGNEVPLGIITGGESYLNSDTRDATTERDGRSLPSGEYLQELARLKADAAFLGATPELPKVEKVLSDAELLERMMC